MAGWHHWWTWVWVNSRSWWWTGRSGVLQFMGLQRVGHDWLTELNWTELMYNIKLNFSVKISFMLFVLECWKVKVKVAQSCPTLCDPMDYTVHGIPPARIQEWVAFPFSRGSSQPRDWTQVPNIVGRFFTS